MPVNSTRGSVRVVGDQAREIPVTAVHAALLSPIPKGGSRLPVGAKDPGGKERRARQSKDEGMPASAESEARLAEPPPPTGRIGTNAGGDGTGIQTVNGGQPCPPTALSSKGKAWPSDFPKPPS